MSNLAVIPARGGSTRLIDKNVYPLGGKPLIRWMTEAVLGSEKFDKVLISTDSDKIFNAVSDLNVERHNRPKELATTKSTVLSAMIDLMKDYEGYSTFSYFLPTCPLINKDDIADGINTLSEDIDFVVSMTEFPETIQLACQMHDNFVLPVFDNLECGITNSKFIKKYYKPSGAFYMANWNSLLKYQNFFKGTVKGIIVPKERSVDINDILDIKYAESVIS